MYTIILDEGIVGRMQVVKQGLYLHFRGMCMLEKPEVLKLWCQNNNNWKMLGTPVPENGCFCIRCTAPAKLFSGKDFRFVLRKQGAGDCETFFPLALGEPITWIKDLVHARFCLRDEKPGVIVTKP